MVSPLKINPQLRVPPALGHRIPAHHGISIDELARHEDPGAGLPRHVVSGREEMGIHHVHFTPQVVGVVPVQGILKGRVPLVGEIPVVGELVEIELVSGQFKVAVLGGPQLEPEGNMLHVLPRHEVHVPEVDVVGGVQLIEPGPCASALRGIRRIVQILKRPACVRVFLPGRGIEFGAQTGLHGHRQGHARVEMKGMGRDVHVPAPGVVPPPDLAELVVPLDRGVHDRAPHRSLLERPAADRMPGLIGRSAILDSFPFVRSAAVPDPSGLQHQAPDVHGHPDVDQVGIAGRLVTAAAACTRGRIAAVALRRPQPAHLQGGGVVELELRGQAVMRPAHVVPVEMPHHPVVAPHHQLPPGFHGQVRHQEVPHQHEGLPGKEGPAGPIGVGPHVVDPPVLGILRLEEKRHVRRDRIVEAQPHPLLHEKRIALLIDFGAIEIIGPPEFPVRAEFRTHPQVPGNRQLADVEQRAARRIESVIRDQVRDRARHRRHRRVRLRSRRSLLSHPRPGRRHQQARGHRPCDRATQSFHCPPSRFEFLFHHDPRLRDGPPKITFRGDSVLNFLRPLSSFLLSFCHPRH